MKKLALMILALMIGVAMSAQETDRYLFRMLDTSSGLPDNNVRNMTICDNEVKKLLGYQVRWSLKRYDLFGFIVRFVGKLNVIV